MNTPTCRLRSLMVRRFLGVALAAACLDAEALTITSLSTNQGTSLGGTPVVITGSFASNKIASLTYLISNPGSTISNYPVLLRFDSQSRIADGILRPDAADLQVVDSDGMTTLSYWIESGLNTTDTLVWARIPVLASGPRQIGIKLGTTNMVSASSLADALTVLAATNNVLWLAANRGVWTNASGVVTQWLDQSVAANPVVQTTASALPTLRLQAKNNQPTVNFTSSQKMWVTRNVGTPYTAFVVSRLTGSIYNRRVLSGWGNVWLLGYYGGYKDQMYADGWVSTNNVAYNTNWTLYAAGGNGQHTAFYGAGNLLASNTTYKAGPNGISLNGYGSGLSEVSDCEISEVVVIGAYLSSADRQTVDAYLNQKYGVYTNSALPTVVLTQHIAQVRFGGADAVYFEASATNLLVVTPEHPVGGVDVEVVSSSAETSRLADAFTYVTPSWWNAAWNRRMLVTVTNGGSAALANYQVAFTVGYEWGMQSDLDDLRFVSVSGALLPHWVESISNGISFKVWVNVPSIGAQTVTKLWLYYENDLAANVANGDAVFDFFDDFAGNTLNTNKWTNQLTNVSVTTNVSDGCAHFTITPLSNAGNAFMLLGKSQAPVQNKVYYMRWRTTYGNQVLWFRYKSTPSYDGYSTEYRQESGNNLIYLGKMLSGSLSYINSFSDMPWTFGTWYDSEVVIRTTNFTVRNQTYPIGRGWTNGDVAADSNHLGVGFESKWSSLSTARVVDVDLVYVRNSASVEPSVTVGVAGRRPATNNLVYISGRLTNAVTGAGVSGARVALGDGLADFVSTLRGYYEVSVPSNWSGKLVPICSNMMFSPSSRSYVSVAQETMDQNYSARDLTPVAAAACTGVAEAVDSCYLVISNGGNAAWYSQTNITKDGVSAARSGGIGHSQESWMQVTVTGPGTMTYWWKVSSENNWDWLRCSVDGTNQASIAGSVDWQAKTNIIAAGTHVIKWNYTKDGSGTNGSDCGWVDQVQWTPAVTVVLSNLFQTYSGSPCPVSATSVPAGSPVTVTYNGSVQAPSAVGSYVVEAFISGERKAVGTLTIVDRTSISGVIRNSMTGERLAGVTVMFSDGTSVVSDENGDYAKSVYEGWNGRAWLVYAGGLGFSPSQRVFEAVSGDLTGQDFAVIPRMAISSVTPTGLLNRAVSYLDVQFLKNVNAATFSVADVLIDGEHPSSIQSLDGIRFRILFPVLESSGTYPISIGPDIQSSDGDWLDQNRNGIAGEPGDAYVSSITIDRTPPSAPTVNGFALAPATNTILQPPVSLSGTRDSDADIIINGTSRVARGSTTWSYDMADLRAGNRTLNIWSSDPSGNTSSVVQLNFTIQWDKAFTSSATVDVNNATYENQDVLINGATVTVNGAHTFGVLALTNGGKIVHAALPMWGTNGLSIQATRLVIYTNSSIDVSGLGWTGTNTAIYAGGSHGGLGGSYSGANPPDTYGSYREPVLPGFGGSPSNTNCRGGGIVYVKANELVLDGSIRANGIAGNGPGGAGGSIWLDVGILRGMGSLTATGALAGSGTGCGGGGRIAVYYSDASAYSISRIRADASITYSAGTGAGAGTIYWRDKNQADGLLLVNNSGPSGTNGVTGLNTALQDPMMVISGSVRLTSGGTFPHVVASNGFIRQMGAMTGSTIRLVGGGWEQNAALSVQDVVATSAVWTVNAPLSVSGNWQFRKGTLVQYAGIELPFNGKLLVDGWTLSRAYTQQWSEISVTNAGMITHPASPNFQTNQLFLVASTIRISTNSSIDVTGRGWTGTNTAQGAGGSHGGSGGAYAGNNAYPPPTYGDYASPITPGMGGSASNEMFRGGGVIRIQADELVLDGTLRADGGSGSYFYYSPGAGGSILVEAGLLRGVGSMSATGGISTASYGNGGGGGGRIAVYYNDASGFDLNRIVARGGPGYSGTSGGAGTVYVRNKSTSSSLLTIHNGSVSTAGETVVTGAVEDPMVVVNSSVRFAGGFALPEITATNATIRLAGSMTGTSVRVVNSRLEQSGALSLQNVNATGTVWTANGVLSVANGFHYKGGVLTQGDRLDLPFGGNLLVDGWTLSRAYTQQWSEITVTNAGRITHPSSPNFQTNRVFLEARAIRISSNSAIDVTGCGWTGTNTTQGAGGSHGGLGGAYVANNSYPPATYGDYMSPITPGMGGSTSNELFRGGGVIRIRADELVLDGALRADGGSSSLGYGAGSGAGGSILVDAGLLRGTGSMSATGGLNNSTYPCGGGGGGRIAVYYNDASGFGLTNLVVWGGRGYTGGSNGLPGTVYTENRLAEPQILTVAPAGAIRDAVSALQIRFRTAIDPATFTLDDLSLTGPSGAVSFSSLQASGTVSYVANLSTPITQDGTYTLTIGPVIAATNGLVMTNVWTGGFTLDQAPPAAPVVTNYAVLPTINNIRTNTILVRGTRDSNTALDINGVEQIPMGSGAWSYPMTLVQGTNSADFVSRDAAGNQSSVTSVRWVMDTIAPQVSSMFPASGSSTNIVPALLSIAIQESGSGVDIDRSSVTVKLNGVVWSGTRVMNGSALEFTPSLPWQVGTYDVQVRLVDRLANTGTIYTGTFTFDDVAPSAPGVYPVSSPTIIAHQLISGLKEPYASVWLNGTQVVSSIASESWSYDAPLVLGANTLAFSLRDRAGNASPSTSVSIIYDNQAPGPVALSADGQRDGMSVKLDWPFYNEVANGDDIATYRIYRSSDSFTNALLAQQIGTVTAGIKTYTATGLLRGVTYYFAVVAVDRTGLYRTDVTSVSANTADLTAPANPSSLRYDCYRSNLVVRWNAPVDADLAGYHLFFNSTTNAVTIDKTTLSWDAGGGLIAASGYPVRITTFDQLNNESAGTTGLAITLLSNPTGLTATPKYGMADLAWSASMPTQYVKKYWVYVSSNDFTNVAGLYARATLTDRQRSIAGLDVGRTYYVGVVVENLCGGMDSNVTTASIVPVADTNAPVVQYITFDGVVMDGSQVVAYPGTFGTRIRDDGALARIEFWLDGEHVHLDSSGQTNSTWAWSDIKSASNGTHVLEVVAYDTFGNSGRASNTFTVAMGPPTRAPILTAPANNLALVDQTRVTVQGTVDAESDEVVVYLNGVATGVVTRGASGAFLYALDLSEGTNRILAVGRNRTGTSPFSSVVKVSVYITRPEVELPPEVALIPGAPTALQVTSMSSGRVSVTWFWPTENSSWAASYHIYRSTGGTGAYVQVGTKSAWQAELIDLPPVDGTYCYQVSAKNAQGIEGPRTAPVCGVSDRVPPRLLAMHYEATEAVTVDRIPDPEGGPYDTLVYTTNPAAQQVRGWWGAGGLKTVSTFSEPTRGGLTWEGRGLRTDYRLKGLTFVIVDPRRDRRLDFRQYGMYFPRIDACDLAGNMAVADDGVITSLWVNTFGPIVTNVVWSPSALIRNNPTNPAVVSAILYFQEDALPVGEWRLKRRFGYQYWQGNWTNTQVSQVGPNAWSTTFTLPADAGLDWGNLPYYLYLGYEALDDRGYGNMEILPRETFYKCTAQIYTSIRTNIGTIPEVQLGPGGQVHLSWMEPGSDEVITNAQYTYEVYRASRYIQPDFILLNTTTSTNFTETRPEGTNLYYVRVIRTLNGEVGAGPMATSEYPPFTASVLFDWTRPNPPSNVHLTVSSKGVKVNWKADGEHRGYRRNPSTGQIDWFVEETYNLYRSSLPFYSTNGLSPLRTNINVFEAWDYSPRSGAAYYALTATDISSNESVLSVFAYTNFLNVPVSRLDIQQIGNGSPTITWAHTNRSGLFGFNVYIATASETQKVNEAVLSPWTPAYVDATYDGSPRSYGVGALLLEGTNPVESLVRWIDIPDVDVTLDSGSTFKRGVINRLTYTLANQTTQAMSDLTFDVYMQGASQRVSSIFIDARSTQQVSVVFGGYSNVYGTIVVSNTLTVAPNPGETVRLIHSDQLQTGVGALVAEIKPERFYKGGVGTARMVLRNTCEEDVEVVVAKNNGALKSPEVRMKVVDRAGTVLSAGYLTQSTGAGIVNLPDGTTVARLAPGQSFTSDPMEMTVPSVLGDSATVRLEIDKIHYHYGWSDHVEINGPGATKTISLQSVPYAVIVTNVTPTFSLVPTDVQISGTTEALGALATLSRLPIRVVVDLRGFERSYDMYTDEEGRWKLTFRPLSTEGGVYQVYAMHPSLVEKASQGQFEIRRVMVSPSILKLTMPRNFTYNLSIRVTPNADLNLSNVVAVCVAQDQTNGVMPVGITTASGPGLNIAGGRTVSIGCSIRADQTAPDTGTLVFRLISAHDPDTVWNTVKVLYTLDGEAQPTLDWTPSYVESSVTRSNSSTEAVDLKNTGFADLENVRLSLVSTNGQPVPAWVMLNGAPALGAMATGATRTVHVTFSPTNGVALTPTAPYKFYLQVVADNYRTCNVPLYVTVDESGKGGASFHVTDIYTATEDAQGQLIRGLAGARIRLIKETGIEFETNLLTDAWGEAEVSGLPVGRYAARISAPEHKSQTVRIAVREGMTDAREVFLENTLVTVEWSVTPTTIQDQYEVTLTTTFRTEVPAAVLVTEPTSVTLPKMEKGDVFNGEFVIKNYGLIQAEDAVLTPVFQSDEYWLEALAELPSIIPAHGVIRMPYRVVCLSTRNDATAGGGGGGGCIGVNARWKCPGGQKADASAPFCITAGDAGDDVGGDAGVPDSEMEDFAGTGGGSSGGGGIGPEAASLGGGAGDDECKGSKSGEEKEGDCGESETEEPVGSAIDLTIGKFVDSQTDLVVPILGHDLGVVRTFTGNKWHWNFITSSNEYDRVLAEGMSLYRSEIEEFNFESSLDGSVLMWYETTVGLLAQKGTWNCFSYMRGGDCWPLQGDAGTVRMDIQSGSLRYIIHSDETLVYEECAITNYNNGPVSNRRSWSRLLERTSPQGMKMSYAYDEQGRTRGIFDHFGNQVLWMHYDGAGNLASVSDAASGGNTVRYQFDVAGNLTNAMDQLGHGHAYAYANGKLVYERTRGGCEVHITHSGTNLSSMVTRTEDQLGWKKFGYEAVSATTPEGKLGAKQYASILDAQNNLREIWYGIDFQTKARYRMMEKFNGQEIYRKPSEALERASGPDGRRLKPEVVTDNKGGLVTTTYEDGTQYVAQYGVQGLNAIWALSSETAEDGRRTVYSYDAAVRPIMVVEAADEPDERAVTYRYDQSGQLESFTRQGSGSTPAATTTMSNNDRGLRTSITRPEGGVTQFGYDDYFNLNQVTTPRGHTWSNRWDGGRRLVSLIDPLGQVVSNAYDAVGNVTRVRTAAGEMWYYGYDVRGRLRSFSNNYGQAWAMAYEGDRLASSQSPGGTETYEYDNVGRVIREVSSLGPSRSWQYDQLGRITNYVNQYGEFLHLGYEDNPYRTNVVWADNGLMQITNSYDVRGRKISSITTWGTNASALYMNYDSVGNVTSIYRTADGWKTIYYNSHRQPTQTVDSLNHVMAWRYDDRNNLIWQQDAAGQVTEMTYDREDRQTRLVYPDGRVVSNAYDLSGNLISISDAAGRRAAYGYDALDRLVTQKFYSVIGVLERTVSYAYDANDKITSYDDGTTSGIFTLNPTNGSEGRTIHYGTFSKSHLYTYDAFDRKTSFRGPDGVTYEYGYDNVGRLISLSIPGEGVISFGDYVGQRPGRISYPGGVVQLLSYDVWGSVTSSVVKDAAGDALFSFACERDINQRLVSRTLDTNVETYAYDALGQLEQASLPTLGSQSFAYDAIGNRTNLTVGPTAQPLQYNNRNQLVGGGGLSQTYDDDGNVGSRMYNGTNLFFAYSAEGRLSAIRNASSNVIAQYYYNAWSERLRKTVRGTNTWFYYAEEGLVAEFDSTGGIQRTYGYAPDSRWSHSPLFMRIGTTTYYFLNDQIGTPRKLVLGNGRIVWSADYEPFGAAHVSSNSTVVCSLRGSSQYFDEESGLHYNTFRYYDPLTGRYFTEDPLGLDQGPNLYRFCMNDPLSFVDTQGLEPLTIGAAALLALEAVDIGMMVWDGAKCALGTGCTKSEGCRDLAIDVAMLIAPHLVPARVALRIANLGRAGVRTLSRGVEVGSKYTRHMASPFMRQAPKVLAHKATSGAVIRSTPGKTTTLLGSYRTDMKNVIKELGSRKGTLSDNLAPKPNGFNVLNVDDKIADSMSSDQFWKEIDQPWLDTAIERGDVFGFPSSVTADTFFKNSDEMTMFARECQYLLEHGALDPATAKQVERVLKAGPP